jgi:hypothetical protein
MVSSGVRRRYWNGTMTRAVALGMTRGKDMIEEAFKLILFAVNPLMALLMTDKASEGKVWVVQSKDCFVAI